MKASLRIALTFGIISAAGRSSLDSVRNATSSRDACRNSPLGFATIWLPRRPSSGLLIRGLSL